MRGAPRGKVSKKWRKTAWPGREKGGAEGGHRDRRQRQGEAKEGRVLPFAAAPGFLRVAFLGSEGFRGCKGHLSTGMAWGKMASCIPRDSTLVDGGRPRLTCGRTTVSRCGFSARSAPRMTAAFVPVAPEVMTWLSCADNSR